MTDKLLDVFLNEAQELLGDLERALLKLENDPHNKDGVSVIFRAMHTLKGSAGMFGFEGVNNITHHLESIYQDIRDGKREMNAVILGITFKTLDHLRALINDPLFGQAGLRAVHEILLGEILNLQGNSDSTSLPLSQNKEYASESIQTFYIYLFPNAGILKNGNNTFYLIEDLLALGNGVAFPFFKDIPSLQDIVPSDSFMGYEVVLSTSNRESDIREVFMFVEGECEIVIKKIAGIDIYKNSDVVTELWQGYNISKARGFDTISSAVLANLPKNNNGTAEIQKTSNYTSSLRVSSDRIDDLMNLVSELVTTQARLSLYSNENNNETSSELAVIAENVEKITRRLRDNAFTMSLVPLESLVVRFQRLVRDLSKDLKKEIQFKAQGTDTEIDKSIIEKLTDPLLHLLRNCIDHGVEHPKERLKKGKPAQGTVMLKAYYSGSTVVIEIEDDGAGIDLDKVKEKAISKGIITPDAHLSEKELLDLIFLPGFSTASQVTGISGRGVGMDVVKRNISDIRGEIDVKTTLHKGTTFTIMLPLTLSILDGLLVKIDNTNFVLPLSSVAKCYEMETSALESTFNQWATLDGKRTPFFFLRKDFGIHENKPLLSQIINVAYNGGHVGLAVDKVEGEYQAVLKPLGQLYQDQEEFSGATILGNGSVALVIDPNKLIRKLTLEHKAQQV